MAGDTPAAPTTPEPYGVPETIAHWRRQAELCDSDMQSATFLHCADEIEEVLALVEARSTELTQPETAAGRLDDERLALLLDDDDWLRSHREHDGHWRCTGVGDDPNETCQVMRLVPARSTPAEALDERISENVGVFVYQHRMRTALAAFEEWARVVIPMLRNAGDGEAADFGEDRIAQSQEARLADGHVERLRQDIEKIDHPCHDVCVGNLHADCQCAAWIRQEVLSLLSPHNREADR